MRGKRKDRYANIKKKGDSAGTESPVVNFANTIKAPNALTGKRGQEALNEKYHFPA